MFKLFKKLSLYATVLALVLGPNLVASPALADSDKGEKNRERQEKKLFKTWFKADQKTASSSDDNDEQDDDRLPRGLQHAPGIEKRLENGKGLPFGWWLKLMGRTGTSTKATTTPPVVTDTKAPEIIFSTVLNLTATSARLIWVTNEASNSKVWVSTSTPINLTLLPNSQNSSLTYYHDLTVSGLTASTTYYYALGGSDNAGNLATSTGTLLTH